MNAHVAFVLLSGACVLLAGCAERNEMTIHVQNITSFPVILLLTIDGPDVPPTLARYSTELPPGGELQRIGSLQSEGTYEIHASATNLSDTLRVEFAHQVGPDAVTVVVYHDHIEMNRITR